MKKIITLIGAVFLLAACGTDPIQVNTISSPPPLFNPVMPSQIVTVPVHWTVLTQTQIREIEKKNDPNVVLYALDPTNMSNLSVNMAEIKRYLEEQRVVILTYGKYYGGLMAQKNMQK